MRVFFYFKTGAQVLAEALLTDRKNYFFESEEEKMKKMKKLLALALALTMGAAFSGCGDGEKNTDEDAALHVSIIQYVSHPSLDNCYEGVVSALTDRFGDGIVIDRQIGSDSSPDSDCQTYAGQAAAKNADMIIAIATPAAQSAFAAAEDKDIPVVFCSVSDPVGAGIVESMEKPGYNCSGTADILDMASQVKLIRAFQPEAKKIGVLYTTSEANSIAQLALLTEAAKEQGMEVISKGIQSDADIPTAAAALSAEVDCINNFTDNKVVNNLSVLISAAADNSIPVYGSEIEQVKNGCLASMSIDYVALGYVTGEMAADALSGASLSDMAVKTTSEATPVINTEVASSFGLTIPEEFADAETVVTNK